jgi:hypothetical protein
MGIYDYYDEIIQRVFASSVNDWREPLQGSYCKENTL